MPCYSPLKGYRSKTINVSGKRSLTFNIKNAFTEEPIPVSCNNCIGCRLEYSRQWAIRCIHEASMYEDNCFITLTYNNENLPIGETLQKHHFQKFMRRLRKKYAYKKIRFYHCGEYGDETNRPHYHALLFNHRFRDGELCSTTNDNKLYTSKQLTKIWGKGNATFGEVTFNSAAYCARYILKKVNGPPQEKHYGTYADADGIIQKRQTEYCTMSRRPGIGHSWIEKNALDTISTDQIVIRGYLCQPPKFYDTYLARLYPHVAKNIKARRKLRAEKNTDNTPARLKTKRLIKELKSNQTIRKI